MLILKKMYWDNCFSYGEANYIEFNKEPLTQLVGYNGTGKTSISLMLQEVLYGKNNKNIRKQDIANNKSGKRGYTITLSFSKDGLEYLAVLDRSSTLKFRLYKEGEDISSHTSLNTYKTLAEIIGISDFKVFCQLIYQHSTDSLDFLTATDTNRKKFLISLLQLDRYLELHEHFKDKVRIIGTDINTLQGSANTIESWIKSNENMDFVKQELITVVPIPTHLITRIGDLKRDIININSINRKIITNQTYINDLQNLNSDYYLGSAPVIPDPSSTELRARVRVAENEYGALQSKINKLLQAEGECPQCLQEVNETEKKEMINAEIIHRDIAKEQVKQFWDKIPAAAEIETRIRKIAKEKTEFEKLNQLIDITLGTQTLDLNELKNELIEKEAQFKHFESLAKSNERENIKISAHNSKIEVVKSQLSKMRKDLLDKNVDLTEKECLSDILELLKKTFGTNGLVSYKIESSVKELERKINTYLSDLTHFQIYFKLVGERLNIEVVDDLGNVTSIANLSSGERARVNIATILAIRNILSSLTSTKINLLFLDEVIGVIDAEGKEKLSEVLLQENLNTFIVSHDWSHPLIPRINIVKEGHISRIEND